MNVLDSALIYLRQVLVRPTPAETSRLFGLDCSLSLFLLLPCFMSFEILIMSGKRPDGARLERSN